MQEVISSLQHHTSENHRSISNHIPQGQAMMAQANVPTSIEELRSMYEGFFHVMLHMWVASCEILTGFFEKQYHRKSARLVTSAGTSYLQ